MDTNTLLILIGISTLVVVILILISRAKKKKQAHEKKELESFINEVDGFLDEFKEKGISPIDCDIKLDKDEHLFTLLKSVDWREYRKVRTGKVAGHGVMGRVKIGKGISYRYGAGQVGSQSVDTIKTIDSGDLYLTNKRIIFRGSQGNKSLAFNKILVINPGTAGIEIEKEVGKNVYIPYDFMNNPYKLAMIQFCKAIIQ